MLQSGFGENKHINAKTCGDVRDEASGAELTRIDVDEVVSHELMIQRLL